MKITQGIISFLFVLLCFASFAQDPEQDCINAIPICKSLYSEVNSYNGVGSNNNEINRTASCLLSGEVNSVWYTLTIQTSGKLHFIITPNNIGDDYDWIVYNLTGKSCSATFNDPTALVSCNYAYFPGKTGVTGATNLSSQGAGGTGYNKLIDVVAGETYVIEINNHENSTTGYTIDFSASTAEIFDNVPPKLLQLNTPALCNDSVFVLNFSENVLCNSVNLSDFAFEGPGGPFTVKSIQSSECDLGGAYDNSYTVEITPRLKAGGDFYLKLIGPVNDLCQNESVRDSIEININSLSLIGSQGNATCVGAADGWATVDVSNSTGPFSYTWSQGGTTDSIANLTAGNYAVTVSDSKSCPSILTYTVQETASPMDVDVYMGDISCNGGSDGWISIHVNGNTPPFTYQWSQGATTDSIANISAGNYAVQITNASGCQDNFNFTMSQPQALRVTTNARDACQTGAVTYSSTASGGTGPYSYSYSGDGGFSVPFSSNGNESYMYADTGLYNYTVTVTDLNSCTATASSTARVFLNPVAAFGYTKLNDNTYSFSDSSQFAVSIEWHFDDGDNSFESNPIHEYAKTGYYDVLLIATNRGCQDSASVRVVALNEIGFYIPNSFSPNGDGFNDTFACYGTGIQAFKMKIYNRWGELVYGTDNIVSPWDGKLKDGTPAITGVYAYIIEVYDANGTAYDRKGMVYLMR